MPQVSSYRELQLEMQLKVHWNEDSGRRWLVYLLQWDMRTSMYSFRDHIFFQIHLFRLGTPQNPNVHMIPWRV